MKRIIISGGGTGGHIFPAIAIANALRSAVSGIDILFIGAKGRMEMEKVPAAGYCIEGLTISGFQRRLTWRNLTFPFKVIGSLLKARRIITRFNPDVVIGVGGYASGPTLRMATSMGIPSLIQEQNSFPGVTNRLLANRVRKICVAYDGMSKYFPEDKIVMTGNPIRQDVVKIAGKEEEALKHFGLLPAKKTLLVIGGSLGARTINQAILAFVKSGKAGNDLQVLWQTGKNYYEELKTALKDCELPITDHNSGIPLHSSFVIHHSSFVIHIELLPFIDRMDLAYAAADIIVSRAGAIAISELCVVGKPVILVPSPNVSEDHQTKNARALADKNAAVMMPDNLAVENLGNLVTDLFADRSRQNELSANIRILGISDAAEKIAKVALSLIAGNDEGCRTKSEIVNPKSEIVNPKTVYFLGIGGIGMSALARYFKLQGAAVSGYDRTSTPLTSQLISEGIDIHFSEETSLIPLNPDLVVYTPAVPASNAEFLWFKDHGIPMRKRAEVLGMISGAYKTIAVAGTHGKTTTSTLIAHILHTAGMDQIAFLGGISKNYGTNFLYEIRQAIVKEPVAGCETLPYCVVEADEYDKSFLQLAPALAIITSADADHLDIYSDHDSLRRSFAAFTGKIVTGGSLILKAGVRVTPENTADYDVYDYSLGNEAAFYATNIKLTGGLLHFDFVSARGTIPDMVLGLPGKFNLENAIAALAVGTLIGINPGHLKEALQTYQGVQRRFDFRVRRDDLIYIDDYAHHPEELKACISAVRDLYPGKRITGIFQPHLFSRTRDLAGDFARSLELLDELLLLDIYPAREQPIEGVTSQLLLDLVNLQDKKIIQKDEVIKELENHKPEVLLTLGAGDIDQLVAPITELLSVQSR
jgi:UDP-N-acetylmuramate--alanine ligase